jgi:hypothetical protein
MAVLDCPHSAVEYRAGERGYGVEVSCSQCGQQLGYGRCVACDSTAIDLQKPKGARTHCRECETTFPTEKVTYE